VPAGPAVPGAAPTNESRHHPGPLRILALSEGFIVTLLILAQRAGVEVRWTPSDSDQEDGLHDVQVPAHPAAPAAVGGEAWAERLRAKARELDHFMAR
jgi:hypothetical protein